MRLRRRLLPALVLLALASSFARGADVFVIKPYLQMGDAPTSNSGDLALLWASADSDADARWSVEYRVSTDLTWKKAEGRMIRKIATSPVPPHRLYRASLSGLPAGSDFTYQIRKGGDVVFSSPAKARKSAGQAYRFVAVGDIAQGTPAQKAIAERMVLEKPDFVMVTGDIVYGQGRVSEYRDRYWPVYNADQASPTVGGPLCLASIRFPGRRSLFFPDASAGCYSVAGGVGLTFLACSTR